uniref:ATP synthase complex subunit 8 n=1 Tax=Brachynopus latus TaxID=1205592 RepID=A0A0S2MNL5_9COLE|nr:ATP synthase F0 subunit 8 [Brachynopus latus]
MPQMMPLNWLMMFIFFTMTFLIFNSLNYFSFKYLPKNINLTIKKKTLNWKW